MSLQSRHLMPDGLEFTLDAILRKKNVSNIDVLEQEFYRSIISIRRKGMYSDIKAYIADVYILTVNDVVEVLEDYPDIDCIVVISNWNHYTDKAKKEAYKNGVGVFTFSEFLEALNHRGNRFLETGIASKTENAI